MGFSDIRKTLHVGFSWMKKNGWYAAFSALFSLMLICSNCIEINVDSITDVRLPDVVFINPMDISHILRFAVSFVLVLGLLGFVSNRTERAVQEALISKSEHNKKRHIRLFFLIFLVIIVLWLPYLLSYIPGGIWSDTLHIIRMAKRIDYLTNYHPIAYTVIWRCAIAIGTFLGDEVYGAIVYTICQYIFMAACVAFFCTKLYRWGMRTWGVVATVLYFSLCPIFPHYAISCWVDTLFGCAVLLYSIVIYDFVHKGFQVRFSQGVSLIVTMFMVMFLRNNGIYIVALCSLILLLIVVFSKKPENKKMVAAILAVPVIISAIIQGPVYHKFGYNEENKVESSAVMFQSVAYVICTDGIISDEDLAIIDEIIPIERLKEIYNPICIDGVKWDTEFEQVVFDAKYDRFLSVFLRTVIKNPRKVIEAWLLETLGFWNIWEINGHGFACSDYQNIYPQYDVWDAITNNSLRDDLCWRNHVFPYSGYIWLILLAFCNVMQKEKKYALVLIPSIAGWLTIMIATPIAFHFRYVFYHSLCAPLAVHFLLLPKVHPYSAASNESEK